MFQLDQLRVSLTKNGYIKIARLVAAHPSAEVLDHVSGSHPGVSLVRSQVANVLCADPATGIVPGVWDEIRRNNLGTIEAFTFVAVVFSHHRLVELFLDAGHGHPQGTISRTDFATEKEYTNLAFALSEVGASPYNRGAGEVHYDLTIVTQHLAPVGDLVARLFKAKLRRGGWRDPDEFSIAPDLPLVDECIHQQFNQVFGMVADDFRRWLSPRPKRPK